MEIIDKRIIVPEGTIGRINSTMMDPIESLAEFYRIMTNIDIDNDLLENYYTKANNQYIDDSTLVDDVLTLDDLDINVNYIVQVPLDGLVIESLDTLIPDDPQLMTDYVTTILFTTGLTNPFTLTIPDIVEWVDGEVPEFELNTQYIFAIWRGIAFVKPFAAVEQNEP